MEVTTSGHFRVFESPRDRAELLLVSVDGDQDDPEAFEPVYVPTEGYEGEVAAAVAGLEAGNVVRASFAWDAGTPRFEAVEVVRASRLAFADGVTGLFEAARETWRDARAAGEGMNSRVTRNTDGDPNGALYVFAEQPGARDVFEEFKSGALPLEPLIRRVNATRDDDDPRAMFVMRPAEDPFVVVYVVFRRDGILAETVRDTYDLG